MVGSDILNMKNIKNVKNQKLLDWKIKLNIVWAFNFFYLKLVFTPEIYRESRKYELRLKIYFYRYKFLVFGAGIPSIWTIN